MTQKEIPHYINNFLWYVLAMTHFNFESHVTSEIVINLHEYVWWYFKDYDEPFL